MNSVFKCMSSLVFEFWVFFYCFILKNYDFYEYFFVFLGFFRGFGYWQAEKVLINCGESRCPTKRVGKLYSLGYKYK